LSKGATAVLITLKVRTEMRYSVLIGRNFSQATLLSKLLKERSLFETSV
jgi:hypothetical protein